MIKRSKRIIVLIGNNLKDYARLIYKEEILFIIEIPSDNGLISISVNPQFLFLKYSKDFFLLGSFKIYY